MPKAPGIPPPAPVSPARAAAFELLERLALTDAHSDDLLHSSRLTPLSQADRNLATTLVLGVLRWQIALDALVQPLLSRPDAELASPVATALRLGAFQLRYLDRIPAHAALSESVELVRAAGHGHAAGMVNAVLRKLTRTPPPRTPLVETTAALATRLSHPLWLVTRWQKTYGRAATEAICTHNQQPQEQAKPIPAAPPRPGYPEASASAQPSAAAPPRPAYPEASASAQPSGEAPPQSGYPEASASAQPSGEAPPQSGYPEASASGLMPPQESGASAPGYALPRLDPGSRLVAELAAAAHPHPARLWDACAAPGGKTLILAHRHPAAEILATDLSPRRLRALAARLAVAAPQVRVQLADAARLPDSDGLFDLILCDLPCSGTGTLGRNPELKLRLQPADLSRQAARQREILNSALLRLAPGGRLLYSTCSLEPEENQHVLAAVSLPPGVHPQPLDDILEGVLAASPGGLSLAAPRPAALLQDGHLRTLPGVNFAGDGFFAALFARD